MHKETKVTEITKNGVCVENAEGKFVIPADTVVIAAGAKPNNELYELLRDKVKKIDCIGDAVAVGRIPDAIESAYMLATTI